MWTVIHENSTVTDKTVYDRNSYAEALPLMWLYLKISYFKKNSGLGDNLKESG